MTQESFGTTKDGREVTCVTLDNGTLRASLLTLGATLQDLRLAGLDRPLTLGGTQVSNYEAGGPLHYFGAIVGPVANRIRDAHAELDGRQLEFDHNGKGGHVLHGGSLGLNHKLWEIESADETHVLFSEGRPGRGMQHPAGCSIENGWRALAPASTGAPDFRRSSGPGVPAGNC